MHVHGVTDAGTEGRHRWWRLGVVLVTHVAVVGVRVHYEAMEQRRLELTNSLNKTENVQAELREFAVEIR